MIDTQIRLKNQTLDAIKGSVRLQNRLQLALGKSWFTIQRYVKSNDAKLTTITALNVISEETGIPTNELIEQ